MRKIQMKYLNLFGMTVLFGGFFISCAETLQDTEKWSSNQTEIVCRTMLGKENLGSNLQTKLYIFSTDGDNNYSLIDSVSSVVSGSTRLKLNFANLNKKDFRFLFISSPVSRPETQVVHIDGFPMVFGTAWEKIAISMLEDSLSVDNYYGITELSGKDILQLGTVQGELKRIVGQMVFCFYKTDKDKKPVLLNDTTVSSVLDRISSIDITYKEVPRQITFGTGNHLMSVTGSEVTLKHTIRFSQTEDRQKVVLPQTENSVETADSIPGGAILKGLCLLPSNQNVRVSMILHYYDTTPICRQKDSHIHKAACYMMQTLSLDLPKNTDIPGLNVLPDYFTINNACLPCNRIIDIVHTSSIEVNTVWN